MKRERLFFVESVQKITGLLPFPDNQLRMTSIQTPTGSLKKRWKRNARKGLNMIKKMRRSLRERKQKNALNMRK